ncbi:hypothetical protein [Coleofasciculus sp. H7-2]|uniref:hypothetical protein n=1 Tax=Coleofasciculus sp. H7-2 TaxID=3351545 RepID=UPI00366ADB9C
MKAIFKRIQKWRSPQLNEPQKVSDQQPTLVNSNTTKETTVRAIVNGKLVNLPNGATVEDLRSKLPEIGNDDVMEEGFGGTKPLKEHEALKEGSKVWTVPKIVKG